MKRTEYTPELLGLIKDNILSKETWVAKMAKELPLSQDEIRDIDSKAKSYVKKINISGAISLKDCYERLFAYNISLGSIVGNICTKYDLATPQCYYS